MSDIIKKDIKWIIIICLSSFLVVLNVFYFQGIDVSNNIEKGVEFVDIHTYYDVEVPNISVDLDVKTLKLSDNRNKLILGLDINDKNIKKYIYEIYKMVILERYNIDIYFISKIKTKKNNNVLVHKYKSKTFDEFFKIGSVDYFTILINENNKVKFFYQTMVPKLENLISLIERHRKYE